MKNVNRIYSRVTPVALVLLSVLSTGVLSVSCGCNPKPIQADTTPPVVSPPPQETPASPGAPQKTKKVYVYRVISDENGDRLEPKQIELTGDEAKAPATPALNAMVGQKDSPLPEGTKVLSVTIENSLATVDFSSEFVKNFKGGDREEALVLNAVTATLGQFSTVREVQILVAGKKIESLGGTQTLTDPLPIPQINSDGSVVKAEEGGQ